MDLLKCIITNQNSKKGVPEFDFKLMFENDFFSDEYILETDKNMQQYKNIKYNINKNGEFIGSLFMENYNLNEFMDKFMTIVDDYDVKKLYNKNVSQQLSENYIKFIDSFEADSFKRPNTLIGEVYKLRRVAGLI